MKLNLINLCLFVLLSSSNIDSSKDRKQEIDSLETEMINFFQETLEKNYGKKDAVDLLVKGLNKYHFNYLLEVDKSRLQKINEKLYSAGWLFSYFVDGKSLNDSCSLFVPNGMTIEQYRRSAKYQQDMKRRKLKESSVRFITDSARVINAKYKVENTCLPLKKNTDGFSYYQRELTYASHPALKKVLAMEDATSSALSFLLWELLSSNRENICTDFGTDRDIQMCLTLYFWNYLCHFANINFYTGNDRTTELLEEERTFDNLFNER